MSIEELEERGQAALREAKMVIYTEGGCSETMWMDARGQQIAWCLGVPSLCTNSPTEEKSRCVHFDFYWKLLLGRQDFYATEEDMDVNERLQVWVNQQPLVATECLSLGQYVTKGTWHSALKRWMWGPKQNRH